MSPPGLKDRGQPDKGAALVEFALVLPVFALMLFAMVQLGVIFAGWAQLRNSVQTAARLASVGAATTLPQCGQLAPPECSLAVQIGLPPGLKPDLVASAAIPPSARCTSTLANCADYSWLDGYYIYNAGAWQQVVNDQPSSNGQPSPAQVTGTQALTAGTRAGWTCTATDHQDECTEVATGVTGVADGALGRPLVAVACPGAPPGAQSCTAGETIVVCASLPANAFTGFFPSVHVSTDSSFYMETGTAATFNPANISCG